MNEWTNKQTKKKQTDKYNEHSILASGGVGTVDKKEWEVQKIEWIICKSPLKMYDTINEPSPLWCCDSLR